MLNNSFTTFLNKNFKDGLYIDYIIKKFSLYIIKNLFFWFSLIILEKFIIEFFSLKFFKILNNNRTKLNHLNLNYFHIINFIVLQYIVLILL